MLTPVINPALIAVINGKYDVSWTSRGISPYLLHTTINKNLPATLSLLMLHYAFGANKILSNEIKNVNTCNR